MMEKLDKVKKGLDCCIISLQEETAFEGCDECPYNSVSIVVQDCQVAMFQDFAEVCGELTKRNVQDSRM